MRQSEAIGIIARELGNAKPVVHQVDPFLGLSEPVLALLREIIGPCQEAGLQIERDPVLPATVGIGVEGRLFRVMVATDPQTGEERVHILGPSMEPWDKDTFLALIPDAGGIAASHFTRSEPPVIRRSQTEVLEDMLVELRAIKSLLLGREPGITTL